MNKGKKQQAKELYYQSDLTKTEIANTLGISRQALNYWIKVHNWDKLKESAAVLPSLLAQKCYQIIGHLTDNYLDEMRAHKPVTLTEAETLYKLTLTIRKLKQHSTMCETMEVSKILTSVLPNMIRNSQKHFPATSSATAVLPVKRL